MQLPNKNISICIDNKRIDAISIQKYTRISHCKPLSGRFMDKNSIQHTEAVTGSAISTQLFGMTVNDIIYMVFNNNIICIYFKRKCNRSKGYHVLCFKMKFNLSRRYLPVEYSTRDFLIIYISEYYSYSPGPDYWEKVKIFNCMCFTSRTILDNDILKSR